MRELDSLLFDTFFPKIRFQALGVLWFFAFFFSSLAAVFMLVSAGVGFPIELLQKTPQPLLWILFIPVFLIVLAVLKVVFELLDRVLGWFIPSAPPEEDQASNR